MSADDLKARVIVRAARCGHHYTDDCEGCQRAKAWTDEQLDEQRDRIATLEAEVERLRELLLASTEHEEPPVDPLLIEARKLVECSVHWSPQTDRDLQSGKNDNTPEVKVALAALKRGMELAREGEG